MAGKKRKEQGKCEEICYNENWVSLEQEVRDPKAEEQYRKCVAACKIS